MDDTRKKNVDWAILRNTNGTTSAETASLAVLMDIRDELQKLNRVFECHNFLRISQTLEQIRRSTTKKRKVKR